MRRKKKISTAPELISALWPLGRRYGVVRTGDPFKDNVDLEKDTLIALELYGLNTVIYKRQILRFNVYEK